MRIIYYTPIYLEGYTIFFVFVFVFLKAESRGISPFHFRVGAFAGMKKSGGGGGVGSDSVHVCSH
jgi:hypothetical protein